MFTLEQIKAVHAQVKSGADFPAYAQDMKKLGVIRYEHYLTDGHINYYGPGDFTLPANAKWPARQIAETASEETLKRHIHAHQQGHSDYPTICRQVAGTGIEKWIVDLQKMTCTYFDKAGNAILIETIPTPVS